MEFLKSFLRRHFPGKAVVPSRDVGCFPRILCFLPGWEVLPTVAYTGSFRPNGVSFSDFRYMKGYGFQYLKYIKGREMCHLSLWKGPKGLTDEFYGFITSRKRYTFAIDSYLKDSVHLLQLKGMKSSKQGMWKGYHLSIEGIRKGYLFSWKMVYKRVRVGPRGGDSPYKHLLSNLPPPPGFFSLHWNHRQLQSCCLFSLMLRVRIFGDLCPFSLMK